MGLLQQLLKMPGNGAVAAAIKALLLPKMVLFLLLKMAGHGTVLAAKKYTGGYGAAAAAKDDWQRKQKHFCCLRGCCCSYQRWLAVALLQLLKMRCYC
jgi:uncharacterized protein YceK